MSDIITNYSEQPLKNNSSENLLFRYYPNLPAGSMVQVGSAASDLEEYRNDDECYAFVVDFFGEKKKLYLQHKNALGIDEEHGVNLYEFNLRGIEDTDAGEAI